MDKFNAGHFADLVVTADRAAGRLHITTAARIDEITRIISQRAVELEDAITRAALIDLGWTPPQAPRGSLARAVDHYRQATAEPDDGRGTHRDAREWLDSAAQTTAAQLADLRRALRAYDLAGPLTENRRQALGDVLTLARQLTEE